MKILNPIYFSLIIVVFMATFYTCSSTQKLQDKSPIKISEVYYQSWVSGIEGEGSDINVFLNLVSNPKNIELDSIYFHKRKAKLEVVKENTMFVASIPSSNQKRDIIMSSDPYAEYGNKVPEISKKTAFNLKDDECIISYKEGKSIKYFKIDKILKKDSLTYH